MILFSYKFDNMILFSYKVDNMILFSYKVDNTILFSYRQRRNPENAADNVYSLSILFQNNFPFIFPSVCPSFDIMRLRSLGSRLPL